MDIYLDPGRSKHERAVDLCARLTLTEKVGQVHQQLYGFKSVLRSGDTLTLSEDFKAEVQRFGGIGFLYGLHRADPWTGRTAENGLYGRNAIRAYNMVQRYVLEHSRLGIPILITAEYSHGNEMVDGYMLPANLAAGCTFHPDLFRAAGRVCGEQLRELGVHYVNVSMLDILRDPRWGRSEECFGEDPYLSSQMARAIIEGIHSQNVAVIAKHFCAQGETTGGLNASPARLGERELREIHLPAAQAACEAGVEGFMAAYNEIDGVPCHVNDWLLKTVLRDEFGFDGIVVADGCAIDRLDLITGDNVKSGGMALDAGVDVGLWDTAFTHLEEAVKRGYVSEKRLDEAVIRVLEMKFGCGLFDHPYLPENCEPSVFDNDTHSQSLQLSREGIVLLKNAGEALPLQPRAGQTIAVIGPAADDLYRQMGDYTPPMNLAKCSTLWDGLKQLVSDDVHLVLDDGSDHERAAALAQEADVVIAALGGSSSRFCRVTFDQTGAAVESEVSMDCGEGVDKCHLRLPDGQHELFAAVRGKARKLISVLILGRPYVVEDILDGSDALLCAFYPGPYGGQALAEALLGAFSPSGRLSVSFPHSASQLPVFYNKKISDRVRTYVDARKDKEPLFAFGAGMGYSTLSYSDVQMTKRLAPNAALHADDTPAVSVSMTLHNTGAMDEYAVPMLFVTDLEADITRRCLELKAFDKVMVPAGESRTVSLTLCTRDLAYWNRRMNFVVEPGQFRLTLKDGNQTKWNDILKI